MRNAGRTLATGEPGDARPARLRRAPVGAGGVPRPSVAMIRMPATCTRPASDPSIAQPRAGTASPDPGNRKLPRGKLSGTLALSAACEWPYNRSIRFPIRARGPPWKGPQAERREKPLRAIPSGFSFAVWEPCWNARSSARPAASRARRSFRPPHRPDAPPSAIRAPRDLRPPERVRSVELRSGGRSSAARQGAELGRLEGSTGRAFQDVPQCLDGKPDGTV